MTDLDELIGKLKHNLAAATDRIAELEKDRGSLLATEKGLTPAGERIARLEAALEQANAALRDAQSFVNIEQHRAAIDAARKREPTPTLSAAPGDWPEDFSGENGDYYNKCVHCGQQFRGYKRRTTCKQCAAPGAGVSEEWLHLVVKWASTP